MESVLGMLNMLGAVAVLALIACGWVLITSSFAGGRVRGSWPFQHVYQTLLGGFRVRCLIREHPRVRSCVERWIDEDKPPDRQAADRWAAKRKHRYRHEGVTDDFVELIALGLRLPPRVHAIDVAAREVFQLFCEDYLGLGEISPIMSLVKPAEGRSRSVVRLSLPAAVAFVVLGSTSRLGPGVGVSIDRWTARAEVNKKWQSRRDRSRLL